MTLIRVFLAFPFSFLLALQLQTGFAQIGGNSRIALQPGSDVSHRLLPADSTALMRLRERTELLRAIGLSPSVVPQRRESRNRGAEDGNGQLSPELLKLLRQMAPMERSDQASGTPGRPLLPGHMPSSRSPGNSQRLQRLTELLGKDELSPSEVSQIQKLMQSLNPPTRGETPSSVSSSASGDFTEEQSRTREPQQATVGGSATAQEPALTGEPDRSATSPNRQMIRNSQDGLHTDASDTEYDSRQKMLRQAFGLDPPPLRPGTSRSHRSDSANRPVPGQNGGSAMQGPGTPGSVPKRQNTGSGPVENSTEFRRGEPGQSIADTQLQQNQLPHLSNNTSEGRTRSADQTPPEPNLQTANRAAASNDRRAKHLSEIAGSDQPAWEKLQRIALLARQQTSQQKPQDDRGESGTPFGLSNSLAEKLAGVVHSAAEATAQTVAELRDDKGPADRRNAGRSDERAESRNEINDWTSSMNDWVSRLSEEDQTHAATTEQMPDGDVPGNASSLEIAAWLIAAAVASGTWWLVRRRAESTASKLHESQQRQLARSDNSERDRLIAAFHELIRQSQCGSEDWWHHARAVQQLAAQKPQLATSLRSLATIYEQARYAPDSEPSPAQIAAARAALKQCGQ